MSDAAIFDGTRFVDDRWTRLQEGEDAAQGWLILTPAQWAAVDPDKVPSPSGLVLEPATVLETLGDFDRFALIALVFPKFSDGRAYSLGHQLRTTHGFKGELRAIGDVLFDQLQLMMRCGFDTFEIRDPVTRALLDEGKTPNVTRFYQPGFGAEIPAGTRPWVRQHA
jgi:uncharacterized protein (DUF934 family)